MAVRRYFHLARPARDAVRIVKAKKVFPKGTYHEHHFPSMEHQFSSEIDKADLRIEQL